MAHGPRGLAGRRRLRGRDARHRRVVRAPRGQVNGRLPRRRAKAPLVADRPLRRRERGRCRRPVGDDDLDGRVHGPVPRVLGPVRIRAAARGRLGPVLAPAPARLAGAALRDPLRRRGRRALPRVLGDLDGSDLALDHHRLLSQGLRAGARAVPRLGRGRNAPRVLRIDAGLHGDCGDPRRLGDGRPAVPGHHGRARGARRHRDRRGRRTGRRRPGRSRSARGGVSAAVSAVAGGGPRQVRDRAALPRRPGLLRPPAGGEPGADGGAALSRRAYRDRRGRGRDAQCRTHSRLPDDPARADLVCRGGPLRSVDRAGADLGDDGSRARLARARRPARRRGRRGLHVDARFALAPGSRGPVPTTSTGGTCDRTARRARECCSAGSRPSARRRWRTSGRAS